MLAFFSSVKLSFERFATELKKSQGAFARDISSGTQLQAFFSKETAVRLQTKVASLGLQIAEAQHVAELTKFFIVYFSSFKRKLRDNQQLFFEIFRKELLAQSAQVADQKKQIDSFRASISKNSQVALQAKLARMQDTWRQWLSSNRFNLLEYKTVELRCVFPA